MVGSMYKKISMSSSEQVCTFFFVILFFLSPTYAETHNHMLDLLIARACLRARPTTSDTIDTLVLGMAFVSADYVNASRTAQGTTSAPERDRARLLALQA